VGRDLASDLDFVVALDEDFDVAVAEGEAVSRKNADFSGVGGSWRYSRRSLVWESTMRSSCRGKVCNLLHRFGRL